MCQIGCAWHRIHTKVNFELMKITVKHTKPCICVKFLLYKAKKIVYNIRVSIQNNLCVEDKTKWKKTVFLLTGWETECRFFNPCEQSHEIVF